jgi:hypothetical protein
MVRTVPISVPDGILATLTMDAAMALAGKFVSGVFATDSIGLELIGR